MSMLMREVNYLWSEIQSLKSCMSSIVTNQASDSYLRDEISQLRLAFSKFCNNPQESSTSQQPPEFNTIPSQNVNTPSRDISMVAWNCHGLSNSVPYLQVLAQCFDVILISEHWLWPYELSKLDSIVPGYKGFGCADKRLSEFSEANKGCGGVAILWKASLPVSPVATISSDRITAVQLSICHGTSLSVVGVYLPSSDCPIDVYSEYIEELESTIYCHAPTIWPNYCTRGL